MGESIDSLVEELNTRRPTILQVTHASPLSSKGGLEVYLYDIASHMSRMLPDARVMCLYPEFDFDDTREQDPNVEYFPVHMGRKPIRYLTEVNPLNNLRFMIQALKLLSQVDIVHIQNPFDLRCNMVAVLAYLMNKPMVVTTHGGSELANSNLRRQRLRYHLFHTIYRFVKPLYSVLATDHARITRAPSVCISSYLPREFDRALEQEFNLEVIDELESKIGSKKPILQVASINSRKNQLTTLKALNALVDEGVKDVYCVFICGDMDDKYRVLLERYIDEHGLREYAGFYNTVPHSDIRSVYKVVSDKNGVLILPSTSEGLPLVMLEAMGFGIPVITTNRDGMKDVITNMVDGVLIDDSQDYARISETLNFLLNPNNLPIYTRISDNAYKRSRDYSLDSHMAKLVTLYASLLGLGVEKSKLGLPLLHGVLTSHDHLEPAA